MIFAKYIDNERGKILDAGYSSGTGMQAELLHLANFKHINGIDISEGVFKVASKKNIHNNLRHMTLGKKLDFEDNAFSNTICFGTLGPGYSPAETFE